jgi:hypothetical protein
MGLVVTSSAAVPASVSRRPSWLRGNSKAGWVVTARSAVARDA